MDFVTAYKDSLATIADFFNAAPALFLATIFGLFVYRLASILEKGFFGDPDKLPQDIGSVIRRLLKFIAVYILAFIIAFIIFYILFVVAAVLFALIGFNWFQGK